MTTPAGGNKQSRRGGWRLLGAFWASVVALLGISGGTLQYLGPPGPAPKVAEAPKHEAPKEPVHVPMAELRSPGAIRDPDPALLESTTLDPPSGQTKAMLPRRAADGRAPIRGPMDAYAAAFDPNPHRPRVAILLAGIGLNEAESVAAIHDLPREISLAVSPYGASKGPAFLKLLSAARASGHEYLLELPLEPVGFPLNDPGPFTLLTSLPDTDNLLRLRWVLSRAEGYAGATGVSSTMRGERLAGMESQMDNVLAELADRGLFYIDPGIGQGPVAKAWGRHTNIVIEELLDREAVDARLMMLEQTARDTGAALGLVLSPTPVAVARLAAWSNGLTDRGLALTPVSALAREPAEGGVKMTERAH